MCTVTFIPLKDGALITSNRDEAVMRTAAALPEAREFEHGKILFPRDGHAGGTWIAMHNNGNVMVLLNGAFEKHVPNPPYRKSRGLIFLDIFDAENPVLSFQQTDLDNIEPFTLVIWQHSQLYEARWDGRTKYVLPKQAKRPYIWSSVTLYDPVVIAKRKLWFKEWLQGRQYIRAEDVRDFHEFGGDGDEQNDMRMNREGLLMTLSITGIELSHRKGIMHYKDMNAGLLSVNEWYFPANQHMI